MRTTFLFRLSFLFLFYLLSLSPQSFAAYPIRTQQESIHALPTDATKDPKTKPARHQKPNTPNEAQVRQTNDIGLLGLFSTIVGLSSFFVPHIAMFSSIVAIVLGVMGVQRHRILKGLAIFGICLAIITLLILFGVVFPFPFPLI
jgi:hypothetical protein